MIPFHHHEIELRADMLIFGPPGRGRLIWSVEDLIVDVARYRAGYVDTHPVYHDSSRGGSDKIYSDHLKGAAAEVAAFIMCVCRWDDYKHFMHQGDMAAVEFPGLAVHGVLDVSPWNNLLVNIKNHAKHASTTRYALIDGADLDPIRSETLVLEPSRLLERTYRFVGYATFDEVGDGERWGRSGDPCYRIQRSALHKDFGDDGRVAAERVDDEQRETGPEA